MTDRSTGTPPDRHAGVPSDLKFPVVGIGASAGGMVALRRLFEQMPASSGMAFVVVLHLSPRHESHADAVLQRSTRMPVIQVTKPVPIEANHVYVISPSHSLLMSDGYLRVDAAERPPGRHVAIDQFFRTLADAHMDHAMAIVLSGTASDGTVGLARVKEQGGVTLAQLPEDAEYEDMPRNAIATGRVDFVLPATEMPAKLLELWENAQRIQLPKPDDLAEHIIDSPPDNTQSAERAVREVLEILLARTGHDFLQYKRATVLRRIERRMQVNLLQDLPGYRDHLRAEPGEAAALLDDMLIGVTNFFRDREAFEALERLVVPHLFEGQDEGPRVWVPGCSSGEEAYSLAILLADQAETLPVPRPFQIFASDIDEASIARGRAGVYPESILTDVPPARLRQFFSKDADRYRISKSIRDRVLFALHSVLRDPPFSRLDLISCRNLMIYLDREVQVRLLETFHFALRPGGYLFLGSSESADAAAPYFEAVDKRNRIFRARLQARVPRTIVPGLSQSITPVRQSEAPPISTKRVFAFSDVHYRALERYAPPSLIIDHESNIVHMLAGASAYLKFSGGEPSNNLLSVIDPPLRTDLRTALYQALHTRERADAVARFEGDKGNVRRVQMSVLPFRDADASTDFLLVVFDENTSPGSLPSAPAPGAQSDALEHLETELRAAKSRLQATIEQSEASTEELKASNEELQAINEELRSATEELETSKEELQSVNEELITVNYELRSKVEETAKINDDLQNFISSTDIATVFVDAGLRIKRYTPRAEQIFNIIPGDVGRCLLDITHRLEYPALADDAAAAFETLQLIEREVCSVDGRWFAARVVPYRTAENRIDGAVLTFVDTTALRHARERGGADNSEALLPSECATLVLDPERRVISATGGVADLLGDSEDALVGKPFSALYSEQDRKADAPDADFEVLDTEGRHEVVRWLCDREGGRVPCALSLGRIVTDGAVAAYVVNLRLKRETRDAVSWSGRASGGASVTMRDEFLAIMSHELKNPLNLISVNTELMARLPEVRESNAGALAIDTIRRAIRYQTRIVDDLLDMSRIRTGKLALTPEPMDLGMVVSELVEVARVDHSSIGIELKTQIPATPIMVRGDAARIEQVVWNLLSNAVKFTPHGGTVTVTVGLEENYVRLRVRDTGRGIDRQSLSRIFDMFGQGTAHIAGANGGLGIGLSLVRQLVELHGGRVEAESDGPGTGATFTVWLPRFTYSMLGTSEPGIDGSGPDLANVRVLIVEDDEAAAKGLAELVRLQGATVVVAHDGAQALQQLATADFDVMLSDIGLPDMDGYALARAVRTRADGERMALVALSGFSRARDVHEAGSAGFDAHLGKPISLEALWKALQDTLQARRKDRS